MTFPVKALFVGILGDLDGVSGVGFGIESVWVVAIDIDAGDILDFIK